MKKIFAVLICVVILCSALCLSGCGEKTSITAEDFKAAMETAGYSISDATDQFAGMEHVEKVYIAISADGSYQIEFYQLNSAESAKAIYLGNKNIFENSIGSSHAQSSVELANYSRYYLTTDGQYKVLSQIDNTMIYIDASADYKDAIKEVLDQLGY